ncbi:LacI family transcriptional regulator [Muricauda sp. SCSIO 64092]|uniref:LacI family DNA-binding transcriptional regulator n=1 Tax=Allomuricauda sp. SCSIO 64092 TaxID=2908842 RepID=UPI001FF509D3|nr:LacI family DNA-binding transcriptional regulator [Muricauda sp. SCSIO 64092]UOY06131.1 LacI family transcriptional regulator [Muricauda sp. SCSIO 64092]
MATMTTIKDMAKVLQVSPSTISRALSDSPEISSKTKERVREMAKTLGYVPNHYARSLKSKTTKTIGVVVPNVIDDFFAKVLHGIEKEASKYGFTVLITFSNDSKKSEYKNLLTLINHSVDGILISFSKEIQKSGDYGNMLKIMGYGIPIVMFDRIHKGLPFDSVTIDDFAGSYRATKHLYNSGCQRIAFLSPISNTSVGRSRKEGYLSALKRKENNSLPSFCIEFGSYEKFKELFSNVLKTHRLDGILAADELSAIYSLNTLQQMGYKVPKEISVIGFTNGPMAQSANPALSVVSQHAERVGAKSFQVLKNRLTNSRAKTKNIVIASELLLRNSTRAMYFEE